MPNPIMMAIDHDNRQYIVGPPVVIKQQVLHTLYAVRGGVVVRPTNQLRRITRATQDAIATALLHNGLPLVSYLEKQEVQVENPSV